MIFSGAVVDVARVVLDETFAIIEPTSGGKFITFGSGAIGILESRVTPAGTRGAANRAPGTGYIGNDTVSGGAARVTFLGRVPLGALNQIVDANKWRQHLYIGTSGALMTAANSVGTGALESKEDWGPALGQPFADQVLMFALNSGNLLVARQNQRILDTTLSGLSTIHRFESIRVMPSDAAFTGAALAAGAMARNPVAVQFVSGSPAVRTSRAAVSGTMPAHALCIQAATTSGRPSLFISRWVGLIARVSGRAPGSRLYVGRSGEVCTISGDVMSGGFLSGDIVQPVGVVIGSGGMSLINVRPITFSGYVEPYT